MEYEPQTLDAFTMEKRLELLEHEFFALAKIMNIISGNTEMILSELERRINDRTDSSDTKMCPG